METMADQDIGADVLASCSGDRDAFGRIVSRYQSAVCATTYAVTGSRSLSEELAQETFLTAWERLGNLREPAKIGPWLCAIARNKARTAMRSRQHDPLHRAAPLDGQADERVEPPQDPQPGVDR